MEKIFEEVVSCNTTKLTCGKKEVSIHNNYEGKPTISWSSANLGRDGYESAEEAMNLAHLLIHAASLISIIKL